MTAPGMIVRFLPRNETDPAYRPSSLADAVAMAMSGIGSMVDFNCFIATQVCRVRDLLFHNQ